MNDTIELTLLRLGIFLASLFSAGFFFGAWYECRDTNRDLQKLIDESTSHPDAPQSAAEQATERTA